ncbi:MAG: carboxypeptidase regulatory-like domain-containing protein [Acidobacteriia bacterium]|nr:carboxypeptidase regulatory-like domain-containing protein [Terriglobia bacterium]
MKRLIPAWGALLLALLLAPSVIAQNARVNGQVTDRDGKPWAGVTVTIKSDTGQVFTVKTDKGGKYSQIGLRAGVYTFTLTAAEPDNFTYSEKRSVSSGDDNDISFNFKAIAAQQGAARPEDVKKKEDEAAQFKNTKAHVDAGIAALQGTDDLRKKLRTATADQKKDIQDQLTAAYQTAVTELQAAEQGISAKDTKNHAVILANLGQAYGFAGRHEDAASAYQKSIDLNPQAGVYVGLSTEVANLAVAQTDPAAVSAKVTEAGGNCEKAAALDTTTATATTARCWKNIGIVLSNTGHLAEAVMPLQKATEADPKDAQTWFLLGGALAATIGTKQEGNKMTYIFPPGLTDAYQHCIDADPNGPYAGQAKTALDGLVALSGGVETSVGERAKAKKKK